MRTVTETVIDLSIKSLNDRKMAFMVKGKRKSGTIYFGKKPLMSNKNYTTATANKSNRQGNALIGQVAKQVNDYVFNNGLTEIAVKQQHSVSSKNKVTWARLKTGGVFYYIDISHCYWRIAYLRGYINQKLYDKANNDVELKHFRNMALSCIIAPNWARYYDGGKLLTEIYEDRSMHNKLYKNIRFTAWNVMGEIKRVIEKVHKGHCYGYNTDGIMVPYKFVNFVKQCLESVDFTYTVEKCKKIDNRQYLKITTDEIKRY